MAEKNTKKQVKAFLDEYRKICEKYGMVILFDRDQNKMNPCRLRFKTADGEPDEKKINDMIEGHLHHLTYE